MKKRKNYHVCLGNYQISYSRRPEDHPQRCAKVKALHEKAGATMRPMPEEIHHWILDTITIIHCPQKFVVMQQNKM